MFFYISVWRLKLPVRRKFDVDVEVLQLGTEETSY